MSEYVLFFVLKNFSFGMQSMFCKKREEFGFAGLKLQVGELPEPGKNTFLFPSMYKRCSRLCVENKYRFLDYSAGSFLLPDWELGNRTGCICLAMKQ